MNADQRGLKRKILSALIGVHPWSVFFHTFPHAGRKPALRDPRQPLSGILKGRCTLPSTSSAADSPARRRHGRRRAAASIRCSTKCGPPVPHPPIRPAGLGSLLLEAAGKARVPGGHALTVDREVFASEVTAAIAAEPLIELRREEVAAIPADSIVIIATGPLTSDALAEEIARLTGSQRLYFYDAISPIVEADSVDTSIAFWASRYGKSTDGTADYLNCPFDRERYERFVDELLRGQSVSAHIEEDATPYFEACLPIEELARRGRETLRFGPMKPMGLADPRTGRRPYAVVQLRQENLRAGSFNLVGFQTHLKFAEQARILRLIPGLEKAEFLRFGQIHRNTYINAPALLTPTLQLRSHARVLFAGQISGVEGYVEAIATGLMAGTHAAALAAGAIPRALPRETALGSLCHYISGADPASYQPANITFDLLPQLDEATRLKLRHDKKARHAEVCRRALLALEDYRYAHV
jgi:methylenetetrahydrofolate--tRNA-(uracil-5-)-methyltransferase